MKMIINIPDYRFEQCQKDISTLDLYEELANAVKNGTPLPDNATNGDVIKTMFPDEEFHVDDGTCVYIGLMRFDSRWWNTPYTGDKTDGK